MTINLFLNDKQSLLALKKLKLHKVYMRFLTSFYHICNFHARFRILVQAVISHILFVLIVI